MSKAISGIEFGSKLYEAGLIPENTRRVIIDIPCDGIVTVYYETSADKELFELTLETLIANKERLTIESAGEQA